MASIFKKGRDKGKKRSVWYVSYDDENGKRRTLKGFTDKGLSEQLGAKMEQEAMLRKRGLIDPQQEKIAGQHRALLTGLLESFETSLGDNSPKHVALTMSRVRRVIDGCEFKRVADLDPDAIEKFIQKIMDEDEFGNRTYNHYIQAVDSFCNWLVEKKKLSANPLVGLGRLNTEIDVRHKRRALKPEEIVQLIASARESGEEIQCFNGEQRARIYIVSYMTGLRRKEIASLTPRSFALDANPPTVTVAAGDSKHRKMDVLPLHPHLVTSVRKWIRNVDLDSPLFPKLARRRTWLMVKKDLERVGIAYETPDGIADFHAAGRHTHITELVRSGASLPEAQKLARHTDIKMTMKYTHIGIEDQAAAVAGIPIPEPAASATSQKQTWQRYGSGKSVSEGHSVSLAVANDSALGDVKERQNPCGNRGFDADCLSTSPGVTTGENWRRRESNPRPEMSQ